MTAIERLIPLAHVASVPASTAFYEKLGFEITNSMVSPEFGDDPHWAYLQSGGAALMVALAGEPVVAKDQAVLFYLHTADIVSLRDSLSSAGVPVGELDYPEHMPGGEMRVTDPDGYALLIGQLASA